MSYEVSGRVVLPNGVHNASLTTNAGVITAVQVERKVESDSILIFPGFIDAHVHAREYPRPSNGEAVLKWKSTLEKETFASAGKAAINGGVTLFAAMPNDATPPATPQTYAAKVSIASECPCPTILLAAVTRDSEPWADLPYKVYLDSHPSPFTLTSWKETEVVLRRYKGCRLFFHAEDPECLMRAAGEGPRWLVRPPAAEIRAVDKVLNLAAKFEIRAHICHVSTASAVHLINEFNRSSSVRATSEVTPHHLFFCVRRGEVISPSGQRPEAKSLLECNPPLRSEDDRRFLLEALREGSIDILASDHAPHTLQDKMGGAPGMPHLDTLGAFAGWLLKECAFSPTRIAQILAETPGTIFRPDLERPQGRIEVGACASFTVLDLDGETYVDEFGIRDRGPLETLCGWSPFSGTGLPASVKATVIHGVEHSFEVRSSLR
ncbi:MAG: amidohydrolase family protein [Thermodesulfobacteriota bacterium]